MKYDAQLTELKNLLPASKSILIAVPANASIDQLAASLALFLTFEGVGKQVSIVCDDAIKVGQSYLFGVDHIQNSLPKTDGGNLTLTLEGVAASDGTVPALEKLDWSSENNNLNLVFHVLPGQTFQPAKIVPHYQGGGFNLIFVIGAGNLTALGNIYSSNTQAFSGTHIVNIDAQASNTSFGQTNVLDTNASSVSEIMGNVLGDLGFILNADVASNLLAGIFETTGNLTNQKVNAETYMAVANCLRVGGKKPGISSVTVQPQVSTPQPAQHVQTVPAYDCSTLLPKEAPSMPKDPITQSVPQVQPTSEYIVPPVIPSVPQAQQMQAGGSPEERPAGEGVISETVEPEWLTPKIFKGSSIG